MKLPSVNTDAALFRYNEHIPVMVSVQKRWSARCFDPSLSFAETRNPSSFPSGVATRSVVMQRLKQKVEWQLKIQMLTIKTTVIKY